MTKVYDDICAALAEIFGDTQFFHIAINRHHQCVDVRLGYHIHLFSISKSEVKRNSGQELVKLVKTRICDGLWQLQRDLLGSEMRV